jgi:hypothetical protein
MGSSLIRELGWFTLGPVKVLTVDEILLSRPRSRCAGETPTDNEKGTLPAGSFSGGMSMNRSGGKQHYEVD